MKKIASLVGILALLVTGVAFAQPGVNLAWDDCLGAGGVTDKTRACVNSSMDLNNAHMSFVLAEPVTSLGASDMLMDLQVDAASLPAWWTQGLNRFGGSTGPSTCPSWADGAPSGPVLFGPSVVQNAPSRLRLRMIIAVQQGEERAVSAGTEYSAGIIELKFGPGTFDNPGCVTPACWVLIEGRLYDASIPGNILLSNPSTSNYMTWQGPASRFGCPQATPVRKATWGSIKALYRKLVGKPIVGLLGKMAMAYLAFGVAYATLQFVYCAYRADAGQPSDLPCELAIVWLVFWPLGAFSCLATGQAVLVPSIVVIGVGVAFLGGFIAVLTWMIRSAQRRMSRGD